MNKIIKNGKEYYRFKIGDEFENISGKGSFNKMKKQGLVQDNYDKKNGFIYPFYDASTMNNHIKGYSKIFNFNKKSIKVSKVGANAGSTIFISKKSFNGDHSYYLYSNNYCNEFISLFFNKILPSYKAGTTIPTVKFSSFKNVFINIPTNHQELAKVIKKVLEYKQLSKQLSKQLKDYKLSILQKVDQEIEKYKKNNNHNKYISFKISDEFKKISGRGKGMFSTLNASKTKNEKNIFELYTNVAQNNHIAGYVKNYNFNSKGIKWTENGDAGKTKFIKHKVYIGEGANVMESNAFANEYVAIHLERVIPKYSQGSIMPQAKWPYFKNIRINIPANHQELAQIIKKINDWEMTINTTTKKMEQYIEGVLQLSLKGVINE